MAGCGLFAVSLLAFRVDPNILASGLLYYYPAFLFHLLGPTLIGVLWGGMLAVGVPAESDWRPFLRCLLIGMAAGGLGGLLAGAFGSSVQWGADLIILATAGTGLAIHGFRRHKVEKWHIHVPAIVGTLFLAILTCRTMIAGTCPSVMSSQAIVAVSALTFAFFFWRGYHLRLVPKADVAIERGIAIKQLILALLWSMVIIGIQWPVLGMHRNLRIKYEVGLLYTSDEKSACYTGGVLESMSDRRAIPLLREALRGEHPHTRYVAARLLAHFQEREAIPDIEALLEDDDSVVRGEAAEALGRLNSRQSIPRLLHITLNDPCPWPRFYALDAISKIDMQSAITPALQVATRDPDDLNHCCAVDILSKTADKRAAAVLIEDIRSGLIRPPHYPSDAVAGLERITGLRFGNPEDEATLRSWVNWWESEGSREYPGIAEREGQQRCLPPK